MSFFKWIAKRLTEKSTYTGLAVIAGVVGVPEVSAAVASLGTAIPALVAAIGGILVGVHTKKDPQGF